MEHDGYGYTRMYDICPVAENEMRMNDGRFTRWSPTPCKYEVAPKLPEVDEYWADMILAFIRSTVEWNADHCEGNWHMLIEDRTGVSAKDAVFFVSFDSQRDADEYHGCFALNGGHYERQHEV